MIKENDRVTLVTHAGDPKEVKLPIGTVISINRQAGRATVNWDGAGDTICNISELKKI